MTMSPDGLTFLGGLLMGLASSLHCAGMCGGIASSLMFTFSGGGGTTARLQALFVTQLGRITMYVAAGTFLGAMGSTFYGAFDHTTTYAMLQWVAALALGWIGLSVAGFTPALVSIYRVIKPVMDFVQRAADRARPDSNAGALLSGLAWGCAPCGMVYGALFYAMLAGSGVRGMAVMAGFGLGTLPAVTAVGLGMSSFRKLAKIPNLQIAVGLGIVVLAAVSINIPQMAWKILCQH